MRQSLRTHLVFEAEVNETPILDYSRTYYEHDISVKNAYKFDGNEEEVFAFRTLYGDGPGFSCGKGFLTKGKSYLIYAKRFGVNLHISEYQSMEYVNDTDIERITKKYDCSCTIVFNYPKVLGNGPGIELPPPTMNKCNVPTNYNCLRTWYCKRNSDGRCTWGTLGNCHYM
ncbi:uncharacterized protein LOC130046470 isoform X2 [Ostrea edulis]|uniref:uncharacterized protein LOC130046470 isoform X2 n=1 Tax=Ostrea edulis TaxID=37623 RepID=UPI0024AF1FA3|nr:uncharacterized protein LOC130046470 isoform X2 [Ostrea edulis]